MTSIPGENLTIRRENCININPSRKTAKSLASVLVVMVFMATSAGCTRCSSSGNNRLKELILMLFWLHPEKQYQWTCESPLPQKNNLFGIAAVSDTNVWAVGGSFMGGADGVIVHFDGNTWSQKASELPHALFAIAAAGADNVWVVGANGTILHYNGSAWHAQASGTTQWLYGVSALDANHVWAVGFGGTILFYNGSSWTPQVSGTVNRLNGVSALDATHVWAVGDNGTILFFNGTSWSPQDSGSTCHLHGISARTATDAWAVGFRSTVLHYNGTDWSPVDATTIGGTPHPDESLTSVCALGAQDVWVTSLSFFTSLLHYNGTGWAKITSKSDTFYSAAGINGDKIWAVGQNGKINFYNGSVSSLQSQSVKEIRAISSSDADNTWAVGSAGTILHYNGADWAAQTSGVTTDLYGVSALNADRAWAVGKISTILRWDGLNWSTQESHLLEDTKLMAVAALDENQVWAVGENGVILKYNGLDWNLQDSGTALWLFGVTARDSGNVWAVGEGGTILRYDGAVWCPSESGTYNSLYAVSSTEDGQAWAVGANGTVVRWDGSAWSMQDSGTMKSLRAVYAIGPNDVWAAGGDGALLHWDGTAWRSKPYGHHDNSWYYGVSASDTNNVVAVGSVSFSMGLILRHKTPTVASTLGDEMPNVSEASVDAYLPASLRPGASLPPGRVDLSSELPPVQNQTMDFYPGSSMCGNFSAGYYLFTQWVKHFKRLDWDLTKPEHWMSAMFMFFIGGGGNQGNVKAALTTNGGVDMTEVPFNPEGYGPEAPSDAQREAAMAFKVQDYVAVWDNGAAMPPYAGNDIEAAKARLASGYVLCVEIGTQSGDFPDNQLNPPSLYYDPVLAPYNINHFAVLCGYDDNINPSGADADHRGGFLLVNMWGDAWNGPMHGYLWVSYAWVKHCVSTCYYILGDGPNGPAISGCSTTSAAVGDSVTISGSGFGCLRRKAKVKFNGTPAQCTSFKNNSIIVTVPSGATSGPLIVYDYEGTASNQISFDVLH